MSMFFLASLIVSGGGGLHAVNLRSEYLTNPIGLESRHPRLSWVETANYRGAKQSAYRIIVSSSRSKLDSGIGDLWDSGKVASSETTQIPYAGKPLHSREFAAWKVQVWDSRGHRSEAAIPASFEMGLLERSDWKATWIGAQPQKQNELNVNGAQWIWYPEADEKGEMPHGSCFLKSTVTVASGSDIDTAVMAVSADDHFKISVNGKPAGSGDGWQSVHTVDLAGKLKPGANEILIQGLNDTGKAGVAAMGRIRYKSGKEQTFSTMEGWLSAKHLGDEWTAPLVVGPVGMAPWGKPKSPVTNGRTPYFRKTFTTHSPVVSARAYVSALGLYRLYLDGKEVSHDLLRPGWTDYHTRVQYQSYDVTKLLGPGGHAVGIVLGNGWYTGRVGWTLGQNYGTQPMGLVQVELTHANGKRELVTSDKSWQAGYGPILADDLLNGETFDARLDTAHHGIQGWATAGYHAAGWGTPKVQGYTRILINAQQSPSVHKLQELAPQTIKEMPKGSYIFDMAQNMVGYARLKVKGPAGTTVRIRFAEMLNPDGSIYVTNLRSAKATDTYTLKGDGVEVYEPSFTFHGFRYVEVTGFPGKPTKDAITGVVIGSDNPRTGEFATSSTLVNKLAKNIYWGQRGNYVDVPTDCPQRDERLGWMGDAQIFVRTATYNNDIAGFMSKWTRDVDDAQSPEGGFSDVSPRLVDDSDGAPAWGDAGVIVPWTIYQSYGDKRILDVHYSAMQRWIKYIDEVNPDHIWIKRSNNNFGDWLNVQDDTPREVIATAYFAHSTDLLAKSAKVLGKTEDAKRYTELFQAIRKAFNDKFVGSDGTIKGDSQTDYVIALDFGLLEPAQQAQAIEKLSQHIMIDRKGHLSTGFVGVGYLCPTLTKFGRIDIAYKLLNTDTYPSWGYSIRQGATTIWERWDGWRADKGFQDPGMNSFNHYSLGSVGEWMYNWVAGIDMDPAKPGFSHIVLHPVPGGGLTWAKGSLDTIHGLVETEWKVAKNGTFTLDVKVPANTYATLTLPVSAKAKVTEGGVSAILAKGVSGAGIEKGHPVYQLGSGVYHFKAIP